MVVELTKMSSKGQIVIPRSIRQLIGIEEGNVFAIAGDKNTIILKRIKTPSKLEIINDLREITKRGSERAKNLGISESDVPRFIQNVRKNK
jgi:antitoxin PrlF